MNGIIPVTSETIEGSEKLTCNARDLHAFLGVGRDFSTWFKERVAKYGFAEGVDFIRSPNSGESSPNDHRSIDYALSLDMAKELAMVENNDRGREIRRYFIACERRAREISAASLPDFTNPVIAARAWADAQEQRQIAEKHVIALEEKAAADRPKVIFADAVDASHTSILTGDLAKLIRQNGIEIGQNRLFSWLRDNGYLMRNGESRNLPTQHSMELGLFEIKERTVNNPDGSIRITKTTKITGKGQIHLMNKFKLKSTA